MANLILTTKCNKGCSYCFAEQNKSRQIQQEMSLEFAKKIIDDTGNKKFIRFMGGEPTLYSHIYEITDYLLSQNKKVMYLTNLLFNETFLNYLIKNIKEGGHITILANGTDLDEKNRAPLFIKNFKILNDLSEQYKNFGIQVGLTIDPYKSRRYHKNYAKWILEELHPHKMRLSMAMPDGNKTKDHLSIIKNKKYGKIIMGVVDECIRTHTFFHFDCIILPCLFSNKDLLKLLLPSDEGDRRIVFMCRGCPTDIYPDGTSIPCYPTSAISTPYKNDALWVGEELADLKKIVSTQLDIPKPCLRCSYFKKGVCEGPCLGFFNLSEASKCLKQ